MFQSSGAAIKGSTNKIERKSPTAAKPSFEIDFASIDHLGSNRSLVVQRGDSIQKAVDALPLTGGDITVEPGTYREVVTLRKPHVHFHGSDPSKTISSSIMERLKMEARSTASTVFVEADDVTIDHLSIVNDLGAGKGQAVALHVTGDRAIFATSGCPARRTLYSPPAAIVMAITALA